MSNEDVLDDERLKRLQQSLSSLKEYQKYHMIDFVFPGTGKYRRENYKKALEFFNAGKEHRFRMLGGANGSGKCVSLETTIVKMTDGTEKYLRDIVVGDRVLAYDIKSRKALPANVINTFNNGFKEVFRIHFTNGQFIDLTGNHLVPSKLVSGRYHNSHGTKKEQKIIKRQICDLREGNRMISPEEICYDWNSSLIIHPYLLGALLGDGCLGYSSKYFINKDTSILDRVAEHATITKAWGKYHYKINQEGYAPKLSFQHFTEGNFNKKLRSLGLEVRGEKKFIPQSYLTAPIEARRELLAGLVDTDGSLGDFTNKSEQLVKDFCQLVRSLGGKAYYRPVKKVCTNNGVVGLYFRSYWRMNTKLPLSLDYKQSISKRSIEYSNRIIKKIESLGIKETGCIEIDHSDHCFVANDYLVIGNSFNGAFEMVCHVLGEYPDWWEGKRQKEPRLWWVVAESGETFKSSLQKLLLGPSLNEEDIGTGLIPKDRIVKYGHMQGVADAVSYIQVRHKKGHIVTIEVKKSESKRENLQAANIWGVLFDEEPPLDIYTECLFRLRGSPNKEPGISLLLFTPLKGLTEVVLSYLKDGMYPMFGVCPNDSDKYVVRIEMDEVPHLSEEDKQMYLKNAQPHEIEARTKGFPSMGSGKIYPVLEDEILVDSFDVPKNWPRAFAWDFGWKISAGLWGAKDPNTGTLYLYAEYYKGEVPLTLHVEAIKEMGMWIPGLADPSGGGRNQDGALQMNLFQEKGIDFTPAINDFGSGVMRVLNGFQTGKIKIMRHLVNIRNELRIYRYDEKNPNEPARNQKDHLADDLRYLTSKFDEVAISYDEMSDEYEQEPKQNYVTGRNPYTGY